MMGQYIPLAPSKALRYRFNGGAPVARAGPAPWRAAQPAPPGAGPPGWRGCTCSPPRCQTPAATRPCAAPPGPTRPPSLPQWCRGRGAVRTSKGAAFLPATCLSRRGCRDGCRGCKDLQHAGSLGIQQTFSAEAQDACKGRGRAAAPAEGVSGSLVASMRPACLPERDR